jgi:cytosine/adenosine deaminase-related metal-dependent hydrolase
MRVRPGLEGTRAPVLILVVSGKARSLEGDDVRRRANHRIQGERAHGTTDGSASMNPTLMTELGYRLCPDPQNLDII